MKKNLSLSCIYEKNIVSLRRNLIFAHMKEENKKLLKIIISVSIAAFTALGAALGLQSCNVTRVVTNESKYYQRGDTSIVIQTKVTETYDATKK